jgi:HD-like signal output (HDOD) protein
MDRIDSTATPRVKFDTTALHSMASKIGELPLLPQVLVKILQLNTSAVDYFEQFESLANEDPALAVRIVAMANSAASAPAVRVK